MSLANRPTTGTSQATGNWSAPRPTPNRRRWIGPIAASTVALVGCAPAPVLREPQVPAVTTYMAHPLPDATAGADVAGGTQQRFALGRDIPAEWWQLFHSDGLDGLIRDAISASPSLDAAQATLHAAWENYLALRGNTRRPSVDGRLSGTRQRISGALFGQPDIPARVFNLFDASVSVGYTLDLGGGIRSQLAAGQWQVQYQCFELEGSYLALTANIVNTAVREASLREQMRASTDIVQIEQTQLDGMEQQLEAGVITVTDVLAQRALLAQSRTALPVLSKELEQTRHQLAVLAGRPPSDANLPQFALEDLQLPDELPVSLPATLLTQRPDLRGSEALLKAAAAEVGVAAANRFPQLALNGSYGSQPTDLRDLFSNPASVYSVGAALLQPLFHGGALRAKRAAAVDAYDQAVALYEQTVLQALQNVADALNAVEADAMALRAQAEAESAAKESLDAAAERFRLGAVDSLTLLSAQRDYQQSRLGLAQAQGARYADTAALFAALGGSWLDRAANLEACHSGG
jgi:NodT family efflux transporter outer membrane factor (OMF) lipoprotein